MKLSLYEQETIINFNEAEQTASVYTHNRALRRKLDKLAEERPEDCRLARESHGGMAGDYLVPRGWIKVSPPPARREMTEEQKQRLREQLAMAREIKNKV